MIDRLIENFCLPERCLEILDGQRFLFLLEENRDTLLQRGKKQFCICQLSALFKRAGCRIVGSWKVSLLEGEPAQPREEFIDQRAILVSRDFSRLGNALLQVINPVEKCSLRGGSRKILLDAQ